MASALATFRQYTDAFRTLDPDAVAPFFHLPAVMLTPRGDFAFHSAEDVAKLYAHVMVELREQRYRATVFDKLDEIAIGEGLSAVHGIGRWENDEGATFSRFEAGYVLRLGERDAWKIALATIRLV
jgi:hypothetical protein